VCTFITRAEYQARSAPRLAAKTKTLIGGRASTRLSPGRRTRISFPLTPKAARLLRQVGRLRLKVTVTGRAGSGRPVTRAKTITIKPPPVRHRRH
jgi:hypothetical protein